MKSEFNFQLLLNRLQKFYFSRSEVSIDGGAEAKIATRRVRGRAMALTSRAPHYARLQG